VETKKSVVFFDDLNNAIVKSDDVKHAFPADIESARSRYQATVDGLNKMKEDGVEEIVTAAFHKVIDEFYLKPEAFVEEQKELEEPADEPAGEPAEEAPPPAEEQTPAPPPASQYEGKEIKFGKNAPESTRLFNLLLAAIPSLESEPKTKDFLASKMLEIMEEMDADNNQQMSLPETINTMGFLIEQVRSEASARGKRAHEGSEQHERSA
jgi:hypothetical protein